MTSKAHHQADDKPGPSPRPSQFRPTKSGLAPRSGVAGNVQPDVRGKDGTEDEAQVDTTRVDTRPSLPTRPTNGGAQPLDQDAGYFILPVTWASLGRDMRVASNSALLRIEPAMKKKEQKKSNRQGQAGRGGVHKGMAKVQTRMRAADTRIS